MLAPFRLLILVGHISDAPNDLSIFLQEISHPRSKAILSSWAQNVRAAQLLNDLRLAVEKYGWPFEELNTERTYSEPARKRLRYRSMDTHYLLFLCAETLPYGLSDSGHAGYAQLRLWLLVHALERALRLQPNLRDGHLLEIAKRMVSAGEIQDKWKSFFDQFVVPPTSFHLFNHRVIAHAKMMKSADVPDFAPGSKTLRDRLQDMVSIAHYHEDILEWPGGSRDLERVRDLLEQEQNPDNLVGQTLSLLEHSDEESAVPDADVFPYPTEEEKEDEEDEWVRVVVDARQSYFQQKRSANLCIRLSSEQS